MRCEHYKACLPIIIDGLDDETERRTDSVDIFIHNLLDYRGFASIIQTPLHHQLELYTHLQLTHSIRILISLSLRRAFRRIDNIFPLMGFRSARITKAHFRRENSRKSRANLRESSPPLAYDHLSVLGH